MTKCNLKEQKLTKFKKVPKQAMVVPACDSNTLEPGGEELWLCDQPDCDQDEWDGGERERSQNTILSSC